MLHMRICIISSLLVWVLFVAISAAGEAQIIIAVAADNQEKNGSISKVAGRAPYFLMFDENGNLLESIANPYNNAARGAGSKVASFLADKKITIVIAGRFGSRMKFALETAKIKYVEQQGNILDGISGVSHATNGNKKPRPANHLKNCSRVEP